MKEPIRTLRKSGNSLVIGLTPGTIETLKLKEGDSLQQKTKGDKIIITKIKGDK
jgi:antitoxin component of MazEF toxin-antitoxin module